MKFDQTIKTSDILTSVTILISVLAHERIDAAYVDLFAYYPSLRQPFIESLRRLEQARESARGSLLEGTQDAVLSWQGKQSEYQSAQLGNALRTASEQSRNNYLKESTLILKDLQEKLYQLVGKPDQELLQGRT